MHKKDSIFIQNKQKKARPRTLKFVQSWNLGWVCAYHYAKLFSHTHKALALALASSLAKHTLSLTPKTHTKPIPL
jgi:hypothetical protein